MKFEEFQSITQKIMENHADQAQVSLLLKQLSDDYPVILKEAADSKETATKLTDANEKLRSANMELFLSIGGKKPETPSDPKLETKKETPLKVEDFLDEKGNLK
jgi:hypothetical protein